MKRAFLFGGVPVIAGIALIVVWALANNAASPGSSFTQVLATIETAKVQPGAVDLAYRYELGGREYRNPNGRLTAKSGADRYVPGARVIVYVNPAVPSESFLERSTPAPSPQNLNVGVVLIVIGLPLGIYFLRDKRSQPKPPRKATGTMSRLKPPPSVPRR
jgi:hypothetical protein